MPQSDAAYMHRALRLAVKGQGAVEPNPMVGAVIVKKGQVIGQGYHRKFGGPHAEIFALRRAGKNARGGTLYVTLEPCCHFGKTPPCTTAILAAGIARVVVAMTDPFAKVHGKGIRLLRNAGVKVDVSVLEAEARTLNGPFIKRIGTGKPYVIAKWAQTLDGCIATVGGHSKWISSPASREIVQNLRGRVDAILIGIGTALADDPLLTARPTRSKSIKRIATRIVLDGSCRLPPASQLMKTVHVAPVMIVHNQSLNRAAQSRAALLAERGATLLPMPSVEGCINIQKLLSHLGKMEFSNILVEGGADILASFLHTRQIDEAHLFIAPKILGGQNGKHPFAGPNPTNLSQAAPFHFEKMRSIGPDLYLIAKPR